jgi:hypothetical protein
MPIILRDSPFFDTPTKAIFQRREVPIKPDQIIVWVGLTETEQTEFDPGRPFFPAILDTGHTHNFSIREDHLIRWAGLHPQHLASFGEARIGGERVPLRHAFVWLRPNRRGKREQPDDGAPFPLELVSGIAVYPETMAHAPRLPLPGLRALRFAGLHLTIDCRRCLTTLRTARRFCFI